MIWCGRRPVRGAIPRAIEAGPSFAWLWEALLARSLRGDIAHGLDVPKRRHRMHVDDVGGVGGSASSEPEYFAPGSPAERQIADVQYLGSGEIDRLCACQAGYVLESRRKKSPFSETALSTPLHDGGSAKKSLVLSHSEASIVRAS